MDKIRILHISDLHIAEKLNAISPPDRADMALSAGTYYDGDSNFSRTSSFALPKLKALVKLISNLQPLDGLVVTGDIATTGRPADLVRAQGFFSGVPPVFKFDGIPLQFPTISGKQVGEIMILPGNHDRYKPISEYAYEPGGTHFDTIFGDYWEEKVQVWTLSADAFEVGVISADFTLNDESEAVGAYLQLPPLTSHMCAYAQGRVHDYLLEELVTKTKGLQKSFGDKPSAILWAIHFPPQFPNGKHVHKLIKDEGLIFQAGEWDVKGILCGHTHERKRYRPKEMQGDVYCCGTTTQYYVKKDHPNSCQLFEIELSSEGIIELNPTYFKYDKNWRRFVIDPRQ